MLPKLLVPLVKYFSAFNVFRYLTFRSAYAAVTALLCAFLLGPVVIRWLKVLKFGQSIREDGPESHMQKKGTPTMGGILILASVLLSTLLWADLENIQVWIVVFVIIGFGLVGFMDDWLKIKLKTSDGLSARSKLIGQFLISTIAVIVLYIFRSPETTLLYIPFIKNAVLDLGVFWVPIAIVYVMAWSNAVNLTDGLDGLAIGLVILSVIAFSILTYITGRADWSAYLNIPFIKSAGELTVVTLALMGACVGFLWFNAHPAEVFMGDVGSLSLGGVLAVLALIVKKEVLLFIIGGVFVLEEASVIIQVLFFKITKGKRVFKMAPLHHHFELSGWDEAKVVTRFWILGGLFTIIALSTLKIQ